jgi:hypothetical protein
VPVAETPGASVVFQPKSLALSPVGTGGFQEIWLVCINLGYFSFVFSNWGNLMVLIKRNRQNLSGDVQEAAL